jgi:hypothetical protein
MAENVFVDQPHCMLAPKGKRFQLHVPPQSKNGQVIFHATAGCRITFTNSAVFGIPYKDLILGPNPLNVACEVDQTEVRIDKCAYGLDLSDPTDIIVP